MRKKIFAFIIAYCLVSESIGMVVPTYADSSTELNDTETSQQDDQLIILTSDENLTENAMEKVASPEDVVMDESQTESVMEEDENNDTLWISADEKHSDLSLAGNPMAVAASGILFGFPVENTNATITCGYLGYSGHNGYDLGVATDTPLYSIFSGTAYYYQAYVTSSGKSGSYGNYIKVISDDGKYEARYCHLTSFNGVALDPSIISCQNYGSSSSKVNISTISRGEKHVNEGDWIGNSGSTGNSTGPHCHIELKINGNYVNPDSYISREYCAKKVTPPDNEDILISGCDPVMYFPTGEYIIHSAINDKYVLDIQYDSTEVDANIQLYDNSLTGVQNFRIINNDAEYYTIQSVYSGLWLDIKTPIGNKSNVKLYDDNSVDDEKWILEDAGDGYVYIHSKTGYFLDVEGDNACNNANIQIYEFTGNASQKWRLEPVSAKNAKDANIQDAEYFIHSALDNDYVIDIFQDSYESKANIQLYKFLNNTVQRFRITKSNGSYFIKSVHSGMWLDISLPIKNNANVQLWPYNTSDEEKWHIKDAGNGYVYIISNTGYSLDVQYDVAANNQNIQVYLFNGSASQKWKLEKIHYHSWNVGSITVNPTCTSEGVKTFTCSGCGEKKTETVAKDPSNHSGGTRIEGAVNATNDSEGYTGDTYCNGCNKLLKEGTVIPATGPLKIEILIQPTNIITSAGNTVTFYVKAENAFTYQWQYSVNGKWYNFTGETTDTLTKKVPASWDGWDIRCKIADKNRDVVYSDSARITISDDIIITEQPESVVTAPDVSVLWSVTAEGEDLTYQWQYKNGSAWSNFTGETRSTMTKKVPASWDGWKIRCQIMDVNGTVIYTTVSDIQINTAIIISGQPESITVGPATTNTWSVKATGDGLTYQWQYKEKNKNTWNNFKDATAAVLTKTIPETWDDWSVRCAISDKNGNIIYSKIVKIDINTDIIIESQPEDVLAEANTNVTWEVEATGSNLKYQWQYKTGNNWNNFAGATEATMTKEVQESWNGWPIRCKISDSNGNVIYTRTVTLKIGTAIVISEQPEDMIARAGDSVTWRVKATGDNLTYQWQYKEGKNWSKFSGATGTSLTKKVPETWDGWQIRCMLTDAEGNQSFTNTVTLYIGTPIVISQQPQDVTVTAGQAATWSIKATGDNLTYQWQYKNGKNWNNFAGATGTSMTKNVPASWNGWQVRCQITDGAGHVTYSKTSTVVVK